MESKEMNAETAAYFNSIDKGIKKAYDAATKAREKGYDPETKVDIPLVRDMAERVEGLISVIAPQIVGSGVSKRLKKLEEQFGSMDWRVGFTISLEIAQEKFCKFNDKKEAMEMGIRTGLAYLTSGVVASPLEGFVEIRIRKRKDGKEYFAVSYAGPIRSAGGTAEAVSVIIADYVRKKMGYEKYDPTEDEINRLVTELYDYHERITNLQYLPSPEEIRFLAKNIPVQIDGEPSEKIEVSNYKDLERVDTNIIRNGVCLVLGEGVAQKAPKLWKQLSKWGKEFELEEWFFLEDFVVLQKKIKSKDEQEKTGKPKIAPDYTFIKDLVAGRPVFTHPMRQGGFRLRYGRARTSGYSSACVHPATMYILNQYIATGTQLKVERPGKAAAITACNSIEGPVVKTEDGSVVYINTMKKAKEHKDSVVEILFLGDILINYGDFLNRAHTLVPPGYCEEWWVQELEKATVDLFGSLDTEKLAELVEIPSASLNILLKSPMKSGISAEAALSLSKKLRIPLHPSYTYHWNCATPEQMLALAGWASKANVVTEGGGVEKIILPLNETKRVIELIGLPHIVVNKEYVVIEKEHAKVFSECLQTGVKPHEEIKKIIESNKEKTSLEIVNMISSVKLRDKSGLFVGARMGRPEKAKIRKLNGSPQVLFPVGDEGGRFRCFQSALEAGKVKSNFPIYHCPKCNIDTIYAVCDKCDRKTKKMHYCKICGLIEKKDCPKHGPASTNREMEIDIERYFTSALNKIKVKNYPDLIKGVRGTSNKEHTPEHLAKGILRAQHNIYVNKDGTTRYDMTQLPITHFKPREVGTAIEKLKEMGYKTDVHGKELTEEDQILELKPQDVILPECDESPDEGAAAILFRVAKFMDDLLVKLYEVEPFYNLKTPADLAGHIVLALAPHTSAGIAARIVGFSKTQGLFAHPMLHAATRRDCDGDEACVTLLMDVLVNFSRQYLPAHRGSTQDAPLVLTSRLIPAEVDDMAFDVDVAWKYPLEFYNACLDYKNPWDVVIDTIGKRLGTERQYCGTGFTHDIDNINHTVRCSAYKTLPSMEDKLKGQMDIAEKVRAVDTSDVGRLVIEKHFLKDTKGNLRKFSMQQFRCVNCNEKFRRPPLVGKCTKCGGKIIFTISEGSVIKYLQPAISIAEKYDLPAYLQQTLVLLQRRIDGVFGKEKERQEGLGKWF
ncbi:DNA polymerase II large subunit [Candidatus Woesearchaeota archaeon]|nr:DNA polymerase II large subunit [Candidatus Woesearchaeota archaeon]